MKTDFQTLCEELVQIADALVGATPTVANQGQPLDGFSALANFTGLADRARAALAADHEAAMDDLRQVSREIGEAQADIFRAALADIEVTASELADLMQGVLDGDYRPDSFTLQPIAASLDRARAALAAEADGPAVPESREPASVAGEPSNEDCWQWYTYCPEEGLEMYPDRKQAQSAAQSIMGSYEVAAHSDGWHEDMESVSWGMLVPIEQAQVVERKTAEPDDEFDEWVKYELRPARFGHQPAPPDEGEVGVLLRELRDAAFDLNGSDPAKSMLTRAADLLSIAYATGPEVWEPIPLLPARRHPTPVPVSERPWEREGWCDDEDRCWCMSSLDGPPPRWWLVRPEPLSDGWVLPATALPVPQGESQP